MGRYVLLVGTILIYLIAASDVNLIASQPSSPQATTLMYSTFLGGSGPDSVNDMTRDADGNIYLAGGSSSGDFPPQVGGGYYQDGGEGGAFVMKLNPTGTEIIYTALFGGSKGDGAAAIAVDDMGQVTVAGTTHSEDFPVTSGAYDTVCTSYISDCSSEAFVLRLSADGSAIMFASFLGGASTDVGRDVALGPNGDIYIAGYNIYGLFPVTAGAFQTTYNGGNSLHNAGDGFVARFNSDASELIYSTYLGGRNWDEITALAVSDSGVAYVTGATRSHNFPVTSNAYDRFCGTDGICNETPSNLGYGGPADVFITRLSPLGTTLYYSSFVGGSDREQGAGIAIDPYGGAVVSGHTWSSNFPTTAGAFDRTLNGESDAFLLHLSSSGSTLARATLVGGEGEDEGRHVALSSEGSYFLAGKTQSLNFPRSTDAHDAQLSGDVDIFLSRFDGTMANLEYSTYLGGSARDNDGALVVSTGNVAAVVGNTTSTDFPTTPDALDGTCGSNGACDGDTSPLTDGFLTFFGDGYTIAGRIIDWEDNPVSGVTVQAGLAHSAVTDSDGGFVIDELNAGTYTVSAQHNSFNFLPRTQEVTVPPSSSQVDFLAVDQEDCNESGDADGDALPDGWELCGYDHDGDGHIDIDLPALGADPNRPDIFIEIDWMEIPDGHQAHSHKPDPEAIEKIVSAFANAPHGGTNLHVDVGPDSINHVTGQAWGELARGNSIPHQQALGSSSDSVTLSEDWNEVINEHFNHSDSVFRYGLFVHEILHEKAPLCTSGFASGQNLLVSLGGYPLCPLNSRGVGTVNQQAGTFMHELGHTLGLSHGGSEAQGEEAFNHKPNYLSVMNYSFQFSGLIIDGEDGHFDYSRSELPPLIETSLSEVDGLNGGAAIDNYGTKFSPNFPWLCLANPELASGSLFTTVVNADGPINWNCDEGIDEHPVAEDINGLGESAQTLNGFDDWANLQYAVGNVGMLGAPELIPITEEDIENGPRELTEDESLKIPQISEPRVTIELTTSALMVAPHQPLGYSLTMTNTDAGDALGVVITATLPAGFIYVEGSTSGPIDSDPQVVANRLIWRNLTVPSEQTVELSFMAIAPPLPNNYSSHILVTSTNGIILARIDTVEIFVDGEVVFLPLFVK